MSKYLVYLLFCIAIIQSSCNSQIGHNGACDNITESKNKGVFIKRYCSAINPIVINDSLQIIVQEAWLEKQWKYSKNNTIVILENYQLCINVEPNKYLETLGLDWSIGIDFEKNMRRSSNISLIGDFKTLPPDTIQYLVQNGNELSDNYKKFIIGSFIILKCK